MPVIVSSLGKTTSRNLSIACRSSSALRLLQLLYPIENFAEISRRINRHLVAYVDLEFARELHAEQRRVAFQIERARLQELLERHDFLFLHRIDAAN